MYDPQLTVIVDGGARGTHTLARCVVAGWTGRDPAKVRHHIEELAAIGVPPPSSVPVYYRVAASMVTQADRIETLGAETSGEVEPVLLDTGAELLLGLGSDHTDRALETHSVAAAKQICAKPVASAFWRFDRVADRLDELELRSWIQETPGADWTLYQDGTVAAIRPLAELIAGSPHRSPDLPGRLMAGSLMFCGTLGAIGGVRPAAAFKMELRDPADGRSLSHSYTIETLPAVS